MKPKNSAARSARRTVSVARAAFEPLEQRRLMSGTLSVSNPDGLPSNGGLMFNVIQHPNSTTPNAVHDTNPVLLSNTGTSPLTINSITLSGPFALVSPAANNYAGTVIAAGSSLTITVQFTQGSVPAHSVNETNYTTNSNGGAAVSGSMVINTTDTTTPNDTVTLAGYWQNESEDNEEPNLTTIVNDLAGYDTEITAPGAYTPDLNEGSGTGSTPTYYGSEVASTSWTAADPTKPVTIQTLAEYHTQGNTVHTYYYDATGSDSPTSHLLFTSLPAEGQTLLPHTAGGALAATSFTPAGAFGLRVDNEYSGDAINVADSNPSGGGHHFRFYPLVDANGNTVANSWVVGMDYAVLQTENFDFQDNVFILNNARPSSVPPTPTSLTATSGAAPTLTWSEPAYSALGGFQVYRKAGTTAAFTLLATVPATTTTYTDTAVAGGQSLTYEVVAIDTSATPVQSQPATVTANTPGGPAGNPDTFNAYAGQPTSLDVLANDTDTSANLNPATVTITTASARGATVTVNPTTGVLTYTAVAGATGADTFDYTVADSAGVVSAPTQVTVNVQNVTTTSPTAVGDVAVVLAGGSVAIPVTANDDPVTTLTAATVAVANAPAHGTATPTASGSITYTPAANFIGSDTFTYTVADANGKTSNAATVTVDVGVALNPSAKGGAKSVSYTDVNNTAVTIGLNRGLADVYFAGTGTVAATKGTRASVSGTNLSAAEIDLSGTTAASVLTIAGARNGKVSLEGLTSTSAVGTINARSTVLAGDLTVAGVNTLNLGGMTADNGGATTATVNSSTGSTAITLGTVTDASLTSAVPIRSLKVASWTNTQNGTIGVAAPSIATLKVTKDFAPSLTVTGAVNSATIGGSLGTGYWSVAGAVRNLSIGSTGTAWGANLGPVNALRIRSGGLPDVVTATTLGTATITGDVTGSLTVGATRTIRVAGALNGASIAVSGTLGQLQVTGAVGNSTIATTGNATGITVGSLADSLISVGSIATGLSTASAATVGTSTLNNLRVTGRGTTFSDSAVIAHTITSVTTGQVNAAATADAEGLAAVTFGSATIGVDGGTVRLNKAALANAAAVSAYLTAKNQTLGGFDILFV